MQIQLSFALDTPISLPLSYHKLIQAYIYNILNQSDPEFATFLHDTGYGSGSKTYKLFVFSLLQGNNRTDIPSKAITFYDKVSLEIRSPKEEFCQKLLDGIQKAPDHKLSKQTLKLDNCSFSRYEITKDCVNIEMLSPLCLSSPNSPDPGILKTFYYNPLDLGFTKALNSNTIRKYEAFSGNTDSIDLSLETLELRTKDKYVTSFDNTWITAWNGEYSLKGNPEILTFLYNAGLGSRNSQGFGMFKVL